MTAPGDDVVKLPRVAQYPTFHRTDQLAIPGFLADLCACSPVARRWTRVAIDTGDALIIVGYSEKQRLLLVSFTERAPKVRIISARPATRGERQRHEQIVKKAEQEPS